MNKFENMMEKIKQMEGNVEEIDKEMLYAINEARPLIKEGRYEEAFDYIKKLEELTLKQREILNERYSEIEKHFDDAHDPAKKYLEETSLEDEKKRIKRFFDKLIELDKQGVEGQEENMEISYTENITEDEGKERLKEFFDKV